MSDRSELVMRGPTCNGLLDGDIGCGGNVNAGD